MGITPDFLDELRTRIAVSDVVGRRVRLVRKGREQSGLCPFHNEKTPSFTVNDDKGFYHCFGCGAHGDVIKFVTETEGLDFPEAVSRLAALAGMTMPVYSPENQEKYRKNQKKRKNLYDVMAAACTFFETQLMAPAGASGLAYFTQRGLSRATIRKFHLGFAPDSRTALKDFLLDQPGMDEAMLVEAGLLIRPEEKSDKNITSYDRFRHRVMFPITDREGRVVAFGGRALGTRAKAKYLNSPETPLFHKGRLLYNMAGARQAAYDSGQILVAEGYMDVIAMSEAGFTNAVAPLGTAVTEEQILALWKMAPEPLFCFDGDKAGIRAAHRVAERALPLLKAGHSLRFVHLPEGEDPDSHIRGQGAAAFAALLEQGQPLVDVLWSMKTADTPIDTPEQQAGLEYRLAKTLSEIRHETIRSYYDKAFQERLSRLLGDAFVADHSLAGLATKPVANQARFSSGLYGKKTKFGAKNDLPGVKKLKDTGIFQDGMAAGLRRERLLILTVLNHPWLLKDHDEAFATTEFESAALDKLRTEIIDVTNRESDLEREGLNAHLLQTGYGKALEVILKQGDLKAEWFAWPGAAPQDVVQGWLHVLDRYRRVSDLEKDIRNAERELAENMTEAVYNRFLALKKALEEAKGNEASIEGYGIASGRKEPS